MIDITFNVYSDTPIGKDPDSSSKTLREYHKILWSKELSNGISFELDTNTKQLLHHKSSLGEFYLSSDSICNTYSKAKNMQDFSKHLENQVYVEGKNLTWRNLTGTKTFTLNKPKQIWQELVPDNTDYSFKIETTDKENVYQAKCSHHDCPTGENFKIFITDESEEV